VAGDRLVPADDRVGAAAEREQLAVGGGRAGHGRVEQAVREEGEQVLVDERHEDPLAQGPGPLPGKDREHVGPLPA
jgi:hypothetical protein